MRREVRGTTLLGHALSAALSRAKVEGAEDKTDCT